MQSNLQTMPPDQLVGQVVGQYRVESLLGSGRLSAVYLARHREQQHTAALTIFLPPERFSQEARTRFLQRFTREAAQLTILTHRNLLPIYEYGERYGYPYLITPHMTNGSLADVLAQEERLSPAQTLTALEQVAAGLEYIHRKNILHGTLKTSNILRSDEQTLLVAGVGMASLLQLRGIEPSDQPYAHLLSVADTFLYASAYIAPEVVQGQPLDARCDIYALGIILFELLCGKLPFVGSSPLETALQHVQQPVPSLRAYCSDIPIALELVVQHALARNPEQRFQRVSELVEAFSQVCHGLVSRRLIQREIASPPSPVVSSAQKSIHDVPEEEVAIGNWQLKPPIVTGKIASIPPALNRGIAKSTGTTDSWQILPPIVTGHLAAIKPSVVEPKSEDIPHDDVRSDALPLPATIHEAKPPVTTSPLEFLAQSSHLSSKRSRGRRISRRSVVALLATGSVAAAGAFAAFEFSTAHKAKPTTPTTTHPAGNMNQGKQGTMKKTTGGATPKQAGHTGTVVGQTQLAINSSLIFTNAADGKESLLIHLPNGQFVAYERACTHEGVAVNYDPMTHTIVCPAHNSIFDPAHGAKVLQGPAVTPLANVPVRVNGDGTITTA